MMQDAPDGFAPLFRNSPYTDTIGPLYYRKEGRDLVIATRALAKHANARGLVHGGLLMTIADIAIGYSMAFREDPPLSLVTASITADFAGSAKVGDWIEAHVDVQKIGIRLAFANAYLVVDGQRILRASGVYLRAGDLDNAPARRA
jgi:acyl-coenzyme A thioesterase 13